MRIHCLFAFVLVASLGSAQALPDSCSAVAKSFPEVDAAYGCVCDEERLASLIAPLRQPFRVVAACGLRWPGSRPINLATERVRLDRYTDDQYPDGVLFVSGEARLAGSLLYSPGPAGEFWFTPTSPLMKSEAKGPQLPDLKFTDEALRGLRVPSRLRNADCWLAKATVRIKHLRVVLGDTDEQGSWPAFYEVQDAREFTTCAK